MPKSAPVRGLPAEIEIGTALRYDPDSVYFEITERLRQLADFQAEWEFRMLIPSVDLETVAAEVSVEFPPLDSIVVAVVHLVITHELPDCWSAPEDDLEKLQYIHRLIHLARDHDHHHPDLPARQPAHVRELQPRSKPRKPARNGTGRNGTGHGNGAGAS